jgi:hypothetical protein
MRITPTQANFSPDGPPPSFRIDTDRRRFFAVQVATEALLLNGAMAGRRSRRNFFDSWTGDVPIVGGGGRPVPPEVRGEALEAPTGQATYSLPVPVWNRLRSARQLFYRLFASSDSRLRRPALTVADVDAARAPSVSIARLPAQPSRAAPGRFRGRGVLARPDFAAEAARQVRVSDSGMIQGRDQDLRFAVLDAARFHMIVVECYERGLTDTVNAMPRKPDAIINGQFLSGAVGIDTEGQVIREGMLINRDSRSTRYYIAETWRGADIRDIRIGGGDPNTVQADARAAFGGLGPVLLGRTTVTPLTPWAQSIYDRPATTGRGVIALHRELGLILLLVQQDNMLWSDNARTMSNLRDWLLRQRFDDAVFNDGSDSEALFAAGGWLLIPGWAKDEFMDFAIGFVDRRSVRRFGTLAIDGTTSADGQALARGVARPPSTHYAPRNIAEDLQAMPELAPITGTFRNGVVEAGRATTQGQADRIGQLIQLAGAGGNWAALLYVSSHATRHGALYYHPGGGDSGPILTLANPWEAGFRPVWRNTPSWLVIAGCAVLGLRYSRGRGLTGSERANLVAWHHDIHGAGVAVPGLTAQKQTLFAVYHPGWGWFDRAFRTSGLRGVLGYWYRSPGGGRDVEIITEFTERLRGGEPFLSAWEAANQRAWFEAAAAWAAMVREGCRSDTLATLEDAALGPAIGEFRYYDRFQIEQPLPDAFRRANNATGSDRIGGISIAYNEDYDEFAIEELENVSPALTPNNFLFYSDSVGP